MLGCLRSCVGSVVSIALLCLVAYAGWRWGEPIFERAELWFGDEVSTAGEPVANPSADQPSMEQGRAALDRVEALQRAGGGAELRLSAGDLQSILRYSLPGIVPEGVAEPEIRFRAGKVEAQARVAGARFGQVPELLSRLGAIGDTVGVQLEGTLVPVGRGEVSFVVDGMRIGSVPVVGPLIPRTLDAMGRDRHPDLPENAVLTPLPVGLASAWVRGDSLVLQAEGG